MKYKDAKKMLDDLFGDYDKLFSEFAGKLEDLHKTMAKTLTAIFDGAIEKPKGKKEEETIDDDGVVEETVIEEKTEDAGEDSGDYLEEPEDGYPFDMDEFVNAGRSDLKKWVGELGIEDKVKITSTTRVRDIQKKIAELYGWVDDYNISILRQDLIPLSEDEKGTPICEQECLEGPCMYSVDDGRDEFECWKKLPDEYKQLTLDDEE